MHKVLSSHDICVKLDFILKILGTYIDFNFRKHNMFIENDNIFISITRKQWISLRSAFPHKLVAPLSTINTTWVVPHVGQFKLSDQLGRCTFGKTTYFHHGVHYQIIISNIVYYDILFSILKLNEFQSCNTINVSMIFYITVMEVLKFTLPFEMNRELFSSKRARWREQWTKVIEMS